MTNLDPRKMRLSRRQFATGLSALTLSSLALPGRAESLWSEGSPVIAERDRDIPLIGLEEHFATTEMMRLNNIAFPPGVPPFDITDVGAGRIAHMDEAGLNLQVLSALTPGPQNLPGVEGVDFARKINDWVASDVIQAYPDRFRGFAGLPLSEPIAAAEELERCVTQLGFLGCMTYGAVDGKFLDHPDFAPVLATAEALNVPIYIHPNWASPQAMELYYNDLGDAGVSRVLSGAGYGWHQEVAVQCLRMIVSGVFDRHPNLQIVIGHMGEALPFYYWRFGDDLAKITKGKLQKPVQQYINDNFWITTSAFFRTELLHLALSVIGEDRVLFSTDYPFVSAVEGAAWFRGVDLDRPVKEKIAFKNAQRLLGL